MKKFLSVLSAVGLAVSLAACSPAANNARTNEYRPMNVGPNNPTGTVTGYDKYHRYNNAAGYGTTGYGTTGYGTTGSNAMGSGRYDTYGNGVIRDPNHQRPGVLRDSRDRIMRTQGMNDLGINQNGQRMYSTNNAYGTGGTTGMYGASGTAGMYGMNGYQGQHNSIYQTKTRSYGTSAQSVPPSIGYAHLGDNQDATGRTYNGTSIQNRTAPNGSTLYQGQQANQNNGAAGVYVDRQALASAVCGVAKQIPGVKRATVLATDNQLFVGCDTSGMTPAQAQQVLEKVQKSCENVSPRYYKVYTTNDQNVISKVHNNAGQMADKTDQQFEQMIGHTANNMHKLSTNSESNKSSSSKASPPTHTKHTHK